MEKIKIEYEPIEFVSLPTPPDSREMAREATENLLPPKSKPKYEIAYKNFVDWRQNHETKSASETTLLAYFKELSEKYKPSSLWAIYSMLKSTIKLKEQIDISKYSDLMAMIKRRSEGFKSKKSNILTPADINKFLTEAPDKEFLATKVLLIVGICGACRKTELVNIKVQDVTERGDLLLIQIPTTKTKRPRFFTIGSEFSSFVKKYQGLRPKNTPTDRFFLNYRNGECTVRAIGINNAAKIPQQIATYLNLPDPKSYTGHSFRRSAATLVADSGADITTLKRFGDWKSNAVAEGYIQESIRSKAKVSRVIESAVALSSTSEEAVLSFKDQQSKRHKSETIINVGASTSTAVKSSSNAPIFKFENCSVTIVNHYTNEN